MAKSKNRPWTSMFPEYQDMRGYLEGVAPSAVRLLDFLATRINPYEGEGWTVVNDWLDECYRKGFFTEKRPADIPFVDLTEVRSFLFPPKY